MPLLLFLLLPPRVLALWWSIYRAKRERGHPYCRPIAAPGEQGFAALPRHRVGWPMGGAGRARLPWFFPSWGCMGGRFWQACGMRERPKKTKLFFLPLLHVQGKKKEEQCRFWFLFLFFNMKRRRFGQNAPFHLNKTRRQNASNFKSALNYLLFISIASLSISVSAPIVGRVFHFSPWPLIYAIGPSIDQ